MSDKSHRSTETPPSWRSALPWFFFPIGLLGVTVALGVTVGPRLLDRLAATDPRPGAAARLQMLDTLRQAWDQSAGNPANPPEAP